MSGLELLRFGVAFGDHVVLSGVRLEVPYPGMLVLVGPAGSGKSTLLRTIAGLNAAQPALRCWGQVHQHGQPLEDGSRPALVMQNARLLVSSVRENLVSALPNRAELVRREQDAIIRRLLEAHGLGSLASQLDSDVFDRPLGEQRRLAIVRAVASGATIICVDEPTVGLETAEAESVLQLLRLLSETHGVIVVTHHMSRARSLGGSVALLAGGHVVEQSPSEVFFGSPQTEEAARFIQRGTCAIPSPSAKSEDLAEGVALPTPLPLSHLRPAGASAGPREFFWIDPGRLGGLPRPGIVADLEHDLEALQRLGVTVLVTLEEERTVPEETLAQWGIRSLFFPIPDMHAPAPDETRALCERLERLMGAGDVVAIHCLAGLGRTGTLLAAQLIHRGASPLEAIERVRNAKSRAIQSDAQVQFLAQFAEAD